MMRHVAYLSVRLFTILAAVPFARTVPVKLFQTCQATGHNLEELRHRTLNFESTSDDLDMQDNEVVVDTTQTFQTVKGFGGAFTGAAAANFWKLASDHREEVLAAYFASPEAGGHGYTMGRVPINSCDFDLETYNFAQVANDTLLEHFDREVTHDRRQLIPFIQSAMRVAAQHNSTVELIGSPWSPPAWMKVPKDGVQSMLSSASPNGLLPEFQASWALYFSKWITAYKQQGMHIYGVTVQNENMFAPEQHEACLYTFEYLRDFIKNHMGPILRRDHPDVKILGYDHNKDVVDQYAQGFAEDPEAQQFIDGLGVHWYTGTYFDALREAHAAAPDKALVATEMCDCPVSIDQAWLWNKAERQAFDTLGDLNNWVELWLDWNLILDENGGPSHAGYSCGASVIADHTGKFGRGSVLYQPNYYYTGHFSRHIRPGMRVVASSVQLKHPPKDVLQGEWGLLDADRVAIFPCDGGNRQRWRYVEASHALQLEGTALCLTVPKNFETDWAEMELEPCAELPNQKFSMPKVHGSDDLLYIKPDESNGTHCLRLDYLHIEADVPVHKYWCEEKTPWQWIYNSTDLSVRTALTSQRRVADITLEKLANEMCMTGGARPVLAVTAAAAEDGSTVVVVINRAAHAQTFNLRDVVAEMTVYGLNSPAHSIQTYTWGGPGARSNGEATGLTVKVRATYFAKGLVVASTVWGVCAALMLGLKLYLARKWPDQPTSGVRVGETADSDRTETDGEEYIEVILPPKRTCWPSFMFSYHRMEDEGISNLKNPVSEGDGL